MEGRDGVLFERRSRAARDTPNACSVEKLSTPSISTAGLLRVKTTHKKLLRVFAVKSLSSTITINRNLRMPALSIQLLQNSETPRLPSAHFGPETARTPGIGYCRIVTSAWQTQNHPGCAVVKSHLAPPRAAITNFEPH